jgi:uncharacterized protein
MRPRVNTRGLLALCALLFALLAPAFAAPTFPTLTGRIVDQAGIIPADKQAAIEPKLRDLEDKSGIQLVVATVKSLEGQEIEPYANQLFREWKLGEKQKNNGVLLLVAPNERKVRIEVGYGLEGTLTDALSKVIITNAIAPRFKAGDFGDGVSRGVDDIITALTTDSAEWQPKPSLRLDAPEDQLSNTAIAIALFIFIILMLFCRTCREIFFQVLWAISVSSPSGRGGGGGFSSGGGGFGGGFSGGGGSSGGGGASGSW